MLDGIPLDKLTAPFLLLLAVLMVFLGLLVPRWTYKRLERERDNWKLAFENEQAARLASDKQTAELLELAKTSNNVLQAMFGTSGLGRGAGGDQWEYGGARRNPLKSRRTLLQVLKGIWIQ